MQGTTLGAYAIVEFPCLYLILTPDGTPLQSILHKDTYFVLSICGSTQYQCLNAYREVLQGLVDKGLSSCCRSLASITTVKHSS